MDLLISLGVVERGDDGALRVHAAAARYAPQADPDDLATDTDSPPALSGEGLMPVGREDR
jgi:hypothetical protein